MQWGGRHFVKSAIHTVANLELILKGFEVNVTGSVLNRLHQHQINKLDDGHVIVFQRKIYRIFIDGIFHFLGIDVFDHILDLTDNFSNPTLNLHLVHPASIGLCQGFFDLAGIGHHHLDGVRNHVTQFVNFGGIERVHEGHLKHFNFQPHRDALILLGGFRIHDLLEFIGDHGRIHGNNRSAQVIGNDLQDGFGIHEPEILDGRDGVLRTPVEGFTDLLKLKIVQHLLISQQSQQCIR